MRDYYKPKYVVQVDVCHCCGMPIPGDKVLDALTGLQQRVFTAIKRAGQAGIAGPRLMDVVYADDPSGGPDNPNIISVVATQMNPRLERFGLKLVGKRGPGGGFVLRTLEQVECDA